jgi:hypothetical protein
VPVRDPIAIGVKVTPTLQVSPEPTFDPQVLLATAKSPVAIGVETVREVFRWFVSVTVCGALVVPSSWLAKTKTAGETVTGEAPVPVRLTVWGLLAALSLKVSVPVRAPMAVGENVTATEHVAPAATLVPQGLLTIAMLEIAKSPVVRMLENVSATFSWLVIVSDLGALV